MNFIWMLTFPLTFSCSTRVNQSAVVFKMKTTKFQILQPFESVVRYRLGKVSVHGGRRKTSIMWTNPLIDKMYTFDTRPKEIELSKQQLLTQEMVPASLTVTARRQIFDPLKLVTTTKLFVQLDTLAFLQATLLDAIASTTLSELCGQRRIVSERITQNINAITFDWGIEYDVTITDVEVPKDIVEALKVEEEIVSKIYALVGTNLVRLTTNLQSVE
ncbi:SPFH/Band 7/PHB domain protein [Trichuris suis]|nr:SPFH/Band 7/PHB domain protein [Trichuris suis]